MSNPQTSPTRYGVGVEDSPAPRLSTPENLARRTAAVSGLYTAPSPPISVMLPIAEKAPDDVTLIPDPTPISAAEPWRRDATTGTKTRGAGDAIVIDAAAQPTFSP